MIYALFCGLLRVTFTLFLMVPLVGIPQYFFFNFWRHLPLYNPWNLHPSIFRFSNSERSLTETENTGAVFFSVCSNPNFHVFLLEWIVPGGVFWWLVGQYIIMRCLPAMNTLSGLPRDGIKHIGMKTHRAT